MLLMLFQFSVRRAVRQWWRNVASVFLAFSIAISGILFQLSVTLADETTAGDEGASNGTTTIATGDASGQADVGNTINTNTVSEGGETLSDTSSTSSDTT